MGKIKLPGASKKSNNKFRNSTQLLSANQKLKKKQQKTRKVKQAAQNNVLSQNYFEVGKSANINYNKVGLSLDPNKPPQRQVETLKNRKKMPEVDPRAKFFTEMANMIQKESDYPFETSIPAPETSLLNRFLPEHLDSFATLITHYEMKSGKKVDTFTEDDLQMMTYSKLNIFQFSKAQLRGMVKAYVQDSKRSEVLNSFARETIEKEGEDERKKREDCKNLLDKEKLVKRIRNNPAVAPAADQTTSAVSSLPQDEFKEISMDDVEEDGESKVDVPKAEESKAEEPKAEETKVEESKETEKVEEKLTAEEKDKADAEKRAELEAKRDSNIKLTVEEKKQLSRIKKRQKQRAARKGVTYYGDTMVSNKTGKIVQRIVPKFIADMEIFTYKQRKQT